MITALSVVSLYSAKRNSTLQTIISNQQQQQSEHPQERITGTPLLDAKLEQLQLQHQTQQRLLDYLTHTNFGNQLGFSKRLNNLSQQRINNVWLTAFSFLDSGKSITLDGKALQASQIPLYIDNLARSEQFQGKQFSVFQLQQPEDDSSSYSFRLHTQNNSTGR